MNKIVYKYKVVTMMLYVSLIITSSAVSNEIDSLERVLEETHDIQLKIETLTTLSKNYQNTDLVKSIEYINLALSLAEKSESERLMAEIYAVLGDIAVIQDSMPLAQGYYELSYELFEKYENIEGLQGVTLVLGNIAYVRDDLSSAMKYYMQSTEYCKAIGRNHFLPTLYMNIGSIILKSGHINEAQEYFTKSLELSLEYSDTLVAGYSYANIGLTYQKLDELEIAKEYFLKSNEVFKQFRSSVAVASAQISLAKVESRLGNMEMSKYHIDTALYLIEQEDLRYAGPRQTIIADIYLLLGKNNLKLNNTKTAKNYLIKAYYLAKKNGQLSIIQNAAELLSEFWISQKNTDSAFYYYKIFKTYTDSLNNEDNIRKLAYQEANFEFEQRVAQETVKKEKEIERGKRNSLILIFIIIGLILFLSVLVLLLKLGRNREKNARLKQESLEKELELRNKELELRNKELTTHVIYQVKNNEFILSISKKLKTLLSFLKQENKPAIRDIINELERDSSAETWKEFEIRFQQVHSGFNKNLAIEYPDLTANELKLCAFLKLNMNTKDIAAITYQTTRSIDVARSRLRKKLGLTKDDNLAVFLSKF